MMVIPATQLPGLERSLLTTSLTSREWLTCPGLPALLPIVVETRKLIRRRRAQQRGLLEAQLAVTPERPGEREDEGKYYERELRKLHGEHVALQEWVKATGAKVCVVFEGRDTAGKGGTIKAITARVSPRVFRVVALPAPSERENSQAKATGTRRP